MRLAALQKNVNEIKIVGFAVADARAKIKNLRCVHMIKSYKKFMNQLTLE